MKSGKLFLFGFLALWATGSNAVDPVVDKLVFGKTPYLINQQGELEVPPDFKKISEEFRSRVATRSTNLSIEMTALVVNGKQPNPLTLLGEFKTECAVAPSSIFEKDEAEKLIFKNFYKILIEKTLVRPEWFVMCNFVGEAAKHWQQLLSFPAVGFQFRSVLTKDGRAYAYYTSKGGSVAFFY